MLGGLFPVRERETTYLRFPTGLASISSVESSMPLTE